MLYASWLAVYKWLLIVSSPRYQWASDPIPCTKERVQINQSTVGQCVADWEDDIAEDAVRSANIGSKLNIRCYHWPNCLVGHCLAGTCKWLFCSRLSDGGCSIWRRMCGALSKLGESACQPICCNQACCLNCRPWCVSGVRQLTNPAPYYHSISPVKSNQWPQIWTWCSDTFSEGNVVP